MTERLPRKPTRLQGYDYSQNGGYFVTICTDNREILFGDIVDGDMRLNYAGEIVLACWNDLINHYPQAEYDAFVIMPNHIHAVVVLIDDNQPQSRIIREGHRPSPTNASRKQPIPTKRHGLSQIIGSLKSYSAKRINEQRDTPGAPVWQRGFHDHIIRDEADLNTRRHYILNNPSRWQVDSDNPLVK